MDHKSWFLKFDLYRNWQIRLYRHANPDLRVWSLKIRIRGFNTRPELPKIWPFFTNPMNPHQSLVHRRPLNKSESIQILGFAFPDSFHGFDLVSCVQKICFVDLIHKNKNPTRFDLSQVVRICPRFLQP